MSRGLAGGLFALLLVAGMGCASNHDAGLAMSFRSPANLEGAMDVEGAQWLLMFFHNEGATAFDVHAEGPGSIINHTRTRVHEQTAGTNSVTRNHPDQTSFFGQGFRFGLDATNRTYSSMFLVADQIRWQTGASHGLIDVLGQNEYLRYHTRNSHELNHSYRGGALQSPVAGVALKWEGVEGQIHVPFELEVEGLHRLEWHNLGVSCGADVETCPDDATNHGTEIVVPGVGSVGMRHWSYTDIRSAGGGLMGQGSMILALGGGGVLDLGLDGWVRLPLAESVAGCPPEHTCIGPDARTLHAEGMIRLVNLTPVPSSRYDLQAELSGDVSSIRLDELQVDPSLLGLGRTGTVLVAGVGAGLLVVVGKLLAGLFSRVQGPEDALQHPKRRAMRDLVEANPGLTFKEVMASLEMTNGPAQHHLHVLERSGVLVRRKVGRQSHVFLAGPRVDASQVILQDPELKRLWEWIAQNPRCSESEIAHHAVDDWGWKRSTLAYRLRRLVKAGVLGSVEDAGLTRRTLRRYMVPAVEAEAA